MADDDSIGQMGEDESDGATAPIGTVASEAPDWIPLAAAALASLLGLVVLVGWQFGLPLITSASADGIPMRPLTAAGMLLAAAALWLLTPTRMRGSRRGFGDVLAALTCALGLATLIEYVFAVDLGFDLLLYTSAVAERGAQPPGRISLAASGVFTLVGAALLLFGGGGRRPARIGQWFALAAFLIAAIAVLGFLYRLPQLYAPWGTPPTPLHAALGLLVLGVGVLFARRRSGVMGMITGRDVGGLTARRLLPVGLALPVLLGALVAEGVRAGVISTAYGLFLVGGLLSLVFAVLVWRSAKKLRGIDRERRQAARGLVQSEERFRSLAENASDAMITIDARGAIVFANPAAERLFGYRADELARMRFTELMPERVREAHREAVQRYESSGRRRLDWGGAQFVGLHRDGHEVPLEITLGEYVRDERRYFTGIMRDITERKHAEAAQRLLVEAGRVLSASLDPEATLRGVTRLAVVELADWCVVYGANGEVTAMELAARDLVREVRLREMERRFPPRPPSPLHDVFRSREAALLPRITPEQLRSMAHGGPEHLELMGEIGFGSMIVVPLVTRGRTIGALVLGADPSDHRFDERDMTTARELAVRIAFAVDNSRLYEAARIAREQAETRTLELERVTESRARLMRGFSHDLKNPLGAADGHAELIESGILGKLEPRQRESVASIRRTIRDALALIDDLVELARTEGGQLELRVEQVDVAAIVRDVVDEQRPRAEGKGLALDVELKPAAPAIGDAARVRQIVGNLLTNAVKYTEEGRVTVRVSADVEGAPSPGAWVRVDVNDTGPGIPEEQQAAIFEEFSRIATDVPGSGLGLAISRNLAEALGGALTLRSPSDEGCCFTLWIPASPAKRATDQARLLASGASP
ncbi:MAG TPA: PAS domain S-box protein [Longimicrobiales bacterium]|nr:PAS domain S-box protein [Longimicrobiales bacterium]